MCSSKCCGGGCTVSMIARILLIVGGVNWGLVGVGMLTGASGSWNVVSMVLSSVPTLEAVVYVLVGVAGVMSIWGCKCSKCKAACASCSAGGQMGGNM